MTHPDHRFNITILCLNDYAEITIPIRLTSYTPPTEGTQGPVESYQDIRGPEPATFEWILDLPSDEAHALRHFLSTNPQWKLDVEQEIIETLTLTGDYE